MTFIVYFRNFFNVRKQKEATFIDRLITGTYWQVNVKRMASFFLNFSFAFQYIYDMISETLPGVFLLFHLVAIFFLGINITFGTGSANKSAHSYLIERI